MRPTVRLLSEALVEQIVAEAMVLLRDPGVRVHNTEALRLLKEAGAQVDDGQLVARIPETRRPAGARHHRARVRPVHDGRPPGGPLRRR